MIISSCKTVYSRKLSTANDLGLKYIPMPNTTLNEKFGILAGTSTIKNPIIKYFAIGVGGNDIIVGNHGYTYSNHMSFDGSLFNHVPFVIVDIDKDLTALERKKYRFRKKETINSKEYYCYYLKVIDSIDYNNQIYTVSVKKGSKPVLGLLDTNTDKFLNPVAKVRTPGSSALTDDTISYISNVAKLEFSLSQDELTNLNTAISIKYGSSYKLTEIGVCFGEDLNDEAVGVQIAYHVKVDLSTSIDLANDGNKILRTIEIGGMELLE